MKAHQNKQELFENAIAALISNNKNAVLNILKKYGYTGVYDNKQIAELVIVGMKKSDSFTRDIFSLMKAISGVSNAEGDTDKIISGALKGIGMVSGAWKNAAKANADSKVSSANIAAKASNYQADKSTEKKMSPMQIAGLVLGGLAILIIGTVVIIKSTKK